MVVELVSEGGAPGHPAVVRLGAGVVVRVIVAERKLTILVERSLALVVSTSNPQPLSLVSRSVIE